MISIPCRVDDMSDADDPRADYAAMVVILLFFAVVLAPALVVDAATQLDAMDRGDA